MVNVNVKTPNKRKSVNAEKKAQAGQTPKTAKPNNKVKTPGKNDGFVRKTNGSPKVQADPNSLEKTPKRFSKNVAKTPTPQQGQNSSAKKRNKNKRASESGSDGTPPKKLKMFAGSANLKQSEDKSEAKPSEQDLTGEKKKQRRRYAFGSLRQKVGAGSGDGSVIAEIEKKIKSFETRKDLTKTAKRKLKILQKLRRVASGETPTLRPPTKQSTSQIQKERKKKVKAIRAATEGNVPEQETDEDESSESDYDVSAEIKPGQILRTKPGNSDENEGSEDEDDSADGDEEEESEDEGAGSGEDEGAESGEEEEDSDDNDEEEEKQVDDGKKQQGKTTGGRKFVTPDVEHLKESQILSNKTSRYVLFVGNLSYDATVGEVSEHFKKAGPTRHVRIPNDKTTNKPRGFAYVEFDNEVAYQKGLSLHHTLFKGRRINVLYTQPGKKQGENKKNEVKAKNFKLQAMRKQGQLAGSVKANQKRTARRAQNLILLT